MSVKGKSGGRGRPSRWGVPTVLVSFRIPKPEESLFRETINRMLEDVSDKYSSKNGFNDRYHD